MYTVISSPPSHLPAVFSLVLRPPLSAGWLQIALWKAQNYWNYSVEHVWLDRTWTGDGTKILLSNCLVVFRN